MEKKIEDKDLEKVTGGRIIEIFDIEFVNDGSLTLFNCNDCGMLLAADKGTTSGVCPYCGNNIVVDDPNKPKRQEFNRI